MRLELASFPVEDVVLGGRTWYQDGVLEVDRAEVLAIARRDPRIHGVALDVVRPGESTRIVNVIDVIEPRVKVSGPGVVYPGVCGRSMEPVGHGRTLRLAGVGVTMCADLLPYRSAALTYHRSSIDMVGPAASSPYGALRHLCLTFDTDDSLDWPERNEVAWSATLAVADRLAQTLLDRSAPHVEVFELRPVDPALPKVALLLNIHSVEHYSGSVFGFGESIYGMSRLHPPWLLHPNEILDGCIAHANTWLNANDPLVQDLVRAHGRDFAFLGVLAQRTRWSFQAEKDMTAYQIAKMAKMLGADGVLITSDVGGNDFVEVAQTVHNCVRLGLKTVFMSTEESSEEGAKPPWLFTIPEADAVVSLGSARIGYGLKAGVGAERPAVAHAVGGPLLYTDGDALDGAPVPATTAVRAPVAPARRFGWSTSTCFDY